MSLFSNIVSGFTAFLKYAPYALAGAQAVEGAVGGGNGADKKQLVIAGILAAVHAGESVPIPQVQIISAIVDTVVSALNAGGLLGKPAPSAVTIPAGTLPT